MTGQQYMDRISRSRALPRAVRQEVLRDLQDLFACAQEQGESPEQVIQRLGTPQEYVARLAQERGFPIHKKGPKGVWVCALGALACVGMGGWLLWREKTGEQIIGQAWSTTNILVEGPQVPGWMVFLALGLLLALLGAGILGFHRRKKGLKS